MKTLRVSLVLFVAILLMAQQPVSVSGTAAVTQSGTWTVQPGNTANTTAWKVDGSAVTQPISAASLPLPSGAATSAKQPALGAAGSASSDVISVQGIASMTALKVDGSGVTQPVSVAANVATTDAATSSTGSAVPAKGSYIAGNGSGNLTGYINCDNTAIYDASTSGSTQLVALSSSKKVYICGGLISTSQTTAVSVKLIYGTGTACATGSTNMTPAWPLQAGTSTGPIGLQIPATNSQALATAASNELCINTSTGVSVQALIYYTQF